MSKNFKVIKDTIGKIKYCGGAVGECTCGDPDNVKCPRLKVKKV